MTKYKSIINVKDIEYFREYLVEQGIIEIAEISDPERQECIYLFVQDKEFFYSYSNWVYENCNLDYLSSSFIDEKKAWGYEKFKNTKIHLKNEEQSIILQKYLFTLGYYWGADQKIVHNSDKSFLFINNFYLSFGIFETYFKEHENELIHFEDIIFPKDFAENVLKDLKKENQCSIVEQVCNDLQERSKIGFKKYGVTLDRKDLTEIEWLQHAYEEALDLANYLKKLITSKE